MPDLDAETLSRMQFALTALYHFLFVPLTLGLSILVAIMESVYVMTRRPIWRDMTKFWGLLFGVNFAMGVATGITMEFQFGTNWGYYSQYVGDIFGSLLAIEGLMAFFLEATFVGLFFFGWDKLSRVGHLTTTWLMAIATNFSALWILIANGWMQNPVGARFNVATMRMEMTSFKDVLFNPVAQAKFVHTVSAGYVTGSIFVLAISAYYLLRGREREIARRSMTVAASFGLASALSVVVLGDESGYTAGENQKMKLAAIEAMWQTEPAPASFTLFGLPNLKTHQTDDSISVPWALGLIATRSFDKVVPGISDLTASAERHIRNGLPAYAAIQALHKNPGDADAKATLDAHVDDLGYALLVKRYAPNVVDATDAEIIRASQDTIPDVAALFWSFRFMVAIGFFFIALFAGAFWLAARRRLEERRWFLRVALLSLPLPWVSSELGWIVAEYGRQPWAIQGVLPTYLANSAVSVGSVWLSLGGFVLFYSILAVVDVFLLVRTVRLGPGLVSAGHGDAPGALPQPAE